MAKHPVCILAAISEKGGVAKTSLAVGFAWELRERGARVLLADADVSATRMAREASAAGHSPPATVTVGVDMFEGDKLPMLASAYDYVIIDTPAFDEKLRKAALMAAHVAIVPMNQCGQELQGNKRPIDQICEAKTIHPWLRGAVALVRTEPRTALYREMSKIVRTQSRIPVLRSETTNSIIWQEAMTAGIGVTQYAKRSKPADQLRSLLDEVLALANAAQEAA